MYAHIFVPSEELPLASETNACLASQGYAKVLRICLLFPHATHNEITSHVRHPADRRASYDHEAAFMFLSSLSFSLILSRSILPFSASTSVAATAAVVFGRSRKDDGLMRNLEVSRPTGCGGQIVINFSCGGGVL